MLKYLAIVVAGYSMAMPLLLADMIAG